MNSKLFFNLILLLFFFGFTNFRFDRCFINKDLKFYNNYTSTSVRLFRCEDNDETYSFGNVAAGSALGSTLSNPTFVKIYVTLYSTHPACRIRITDGGSIVLYCVDVPANTPYFAAYTDNIMTAAGYLVTVDEIAC